MKLVSDFIELFFLDGAGDGNRGANCDLFSDTSSVTGVSLADSQRSTNTRSSG